MVVTVDTVCCCQPQNRQSFSRRKVCQVAFALLESMNPIVALCVIRSPSWWLSSALTFGFCLAIGKPICEQLGVKYPSGLPEGMDVVSSRR